MNTLQTVAVAALTCFMLLGLASDGYAADSAAADDQAQQQESASPAQSQPDSGSASQAGPGAAASDRDKRNEEVFKPSEEISEDFAVSFPVDI